MEHHIHDEHHDDNAARVGKLVRNLIGQPEQLQLDHEYAAALAAAPRPSNQEAGRAVRNRRDGRLL